jgi:hypothetical protein
MNQDSIRALLNEILAEKLHLVESQRRGQFRITLSFTPLGTTDTRQQPWFGHERVP